jgi:hypothetical protein
MLLLPWTPVIAPPPAPTFDQAIATAHAVNGISGSHTSGAAAGSDVFLICQGAASQVPNGATCDGVTMDVLDTLAGNNTAGNGNLTVFHAANVGASPSLVYTQSASGVLLAADVSYNNVNAVGTVLRNWGSGTTASSGALTRPANGILLNVLALYALFGTTMSGYSGGTTRVPVAVNSTVDMVVGDATADTTFSATIGSTPWASLTVPIT